MQPKTRQLALATNRRVRPPDLRDQVTRRQRGQPLASILSVLPANAANPLTLVASAISTSQPCSSSRWCTNRAPFIYSITPRTAGPTSTPGRPVRATRRHPAARPTRRRSPARREQADVDLAPTQIQSSVQHEDGPPWTRFSVTRQRYRDVAERVRSAGTNSSRGPSASASASISASSAARRRSAKAPRQTARPRSASRPSTATAAASACLEHGPPRGAHVRE
jgi:hypothetical protein